MQSTITTKGQATIPKEVREHLGVGAGDKVKYFLLPDGRAYMLPVKPVSSLRGMMKRPGRKAASINKLKEAVADEAAERFQRALSTRSRAKR